MLIVQSVSSSTLVAAADEPARLVLRLRGRESVHSLIDRLASIMERHLLQEDSYSLRLSAWGREIGGLLLEETRMPSQDFLCQIAKKVNELQRRILVNPLDQAPLEVPVVANGEIWEEWMLAHYRRLSDYCPFQEDLLRTQEIHQFAADLIAWLQDAMKTQGDEQLSDLIAKIEELRNLQEEEKWLIREQVERAPDSIVHIGYKDLAAIALRKRRDMAEGALADQRDDALTQMMALTNSRIISHNTGIREMLTANEESHVQELVFIREMNARVIAGLRDLLTQAKESIDHLSERLDASEEVVQDQKRRIESLEQRIHAAEAQNRQNQAACNSKRGGGGCVIM